LTDSNFLPTNTDSVQNITTMVCDDTNYKYTTNYMTPYLPNETQNTNQSKDQKDSKAGVG